MRTLCFLHTLQWGLSNYLVEIPGVFASFCRDLLQAPKLFQKDANLCFLHTLQWGLSNYLLELPGVFASFCRDLLQAPNYSKWMRTLCFLHTLQWGLSNYLLELPGVFAIFCTIQRHFIVNYASLLGVFVLGYRSVLTGVPFNYNYRVNFMRWVNVFYFLSSLN